MDSLNLSAKTAEKPSKTSDGSNDNVPSSINESQSKQTEQYIKGDSSSKAKDFINNNEKLASSHLNIGLYIFIITF